MRPIYTKLTRILLLTMLLVMIAVGAHAAGNGSAEYTVVYWVEMPNLVGDPGNPVEMPDTAPNFMVFKQEKRTGTAGDSVALTASDVEQYLYTENHRRFASFRSSDQAQIAADGSAVVNVYYVRGVFTYVFDLGYDKAEMTISGVTYTGSGPEKYTITGKYEQNVVIPGVENGLIPKNTNLDQYNASCIGWALDDRIGSNDVLTYSATITEALLPKDDMPYDGLEFQLRGLWFNNTNTSILACWYEQLPEEEGLDLNRMTINGKVYVNYPATNYQMVVPSGSVPKASSSKGLTYVQTIEPDTSLAGDAARTWQFVYDRNRFTVSFDTGGAQEIAGTKDVMYQQNLWSFDPGWTADTTRASGGTNLRFTGWYTDSGDYVADSLADIWMPAENLHLVAKWEK